MNTQEFGNRNLIQSVKNIKESTEMKITESITNVTSMLTHSWIRKNPAKALGVLAIGGLMMTATVLTPGTASADHPARPLGAAVNQPSAAPLDFVNVTNRLGIISQPSAAPLDFPYSTGRSRVITGQPSAAPLDFPYSTIKSRVTGQPSAAPLDFSVEQPIAAPLDF